MAKRVDSQNTKIRRLEIPFFEGINSLVSSSLSKKTELSHAENVRAIEIGNIEKRNGFKLFQSSSGSTSNYGMFYFKNDSTTKTGLYRIRTAAGIAYIVYSDNVGSWGSFGSPNTNIFTVGSDTTQFDITNPTGDTFRYQWDGVGVDPVINDRTGVDSTIVINAQNFNANNNGTFTVTGWGKDFQYYFEVENTSGVAENNKTIGTGSIKVTGRTFDNTIAEENCFFINSDNLNRYLLKDGTTIVNSDLRTGHLFNSPKARKINYYKNRLYLADYATETKRFKNGIIMSSVPLGIASLLNADYDIVQDAIGNSTTQFDITNPNANTFRYTWDGTGTNPVIDKYVLVGMWLDIDAQNFSAGNKGLKEITNVGQNYFEVINASGVAENNKTIGTGDITISRLRIDVTDTKYIHIGDTIDVYRGGISITSLTVIAKEENTLTVDSPTVKLKSVDELWINGTFENDRIFRWASSPEGGIDVKQYDTFNITSKQNDDITIMENIGEVMIIGTKNSLAIWDDYRLDELDLNIGCTSDNGAIVSFGVLYIIHDSGIYKIESNNPASPKLISNKVKKYIDGATVAGKEACGAGKKGYSVFFGIGDVTLYHPDGSTDKTLSSVVLEYNIQFDMWFVHTDIGAVKFETYMTATDNDKLLFIDSEINNRVFELFDGQLDLNASLEDKEIPFRADTDELYLSTSFEKLCYPKEIIIESERGSGIQCFISLDKGSFYEITGNAEKGCTILKVTNRDNDTSQPPKCRSIKISIRDFTTKLCKINRVAIKYMETSEEIETKPYTYE